MEIFQRRFTTRKGYEIIGAGKSEGDFGAASEKYDDSQWRCVDLPHDFVAEGEYCFCTRKLRDVEIPEMERGNRLLAGGCLEGGVAWYRKWFKRIKALQTNAFMFTLTEYTAIALCM